MPMKMSKKDALLEFGGPPRIDSGLLICRYYQRQKREEIENLGRLLTECEYYEGAFTIKKEDKVIGVAFVVGAGPATDWAHTLCSAGAKKILAVGWCGGLRNYIDPGEVVTPVEISGASWITDVFGEPNVSENRKSIVGRPVKHKTVPCVSVEDEDYLKELAKRWETIDMELAAIHSVCGYFGVDVRSRLIVLDNILKGYHIVGDEAWKRFRSLRMGFPELLAKEFPWLLE